MKQPLKPALMALVAYVVSLPAPQAALADNTISAAVHEYTRSVTSKINRNWNPVRSKKNVAIKLSFKVRRDGSVSDIRMLEKPGDAANEKRALAAIQKSAPFAVPPRVLGDPVDIVLSLNCPNQLNLTVAEAMRRYGADERALFRQHCTAAGVAYPPKRITLLALKDRQQLLLFAGDKELALVRTFPFATYSGKLGPKLRQGDLQIPEGVYRIVGANARDMLSLVVDYPNAFDRARALDDRRRNLGGDIWIHGGSVSTGCVVVSNEDMQEIFVAAHDVGFPKVKLIIAPCDLTKAQPPAASASTKQPKWLPELYRQLKIEMSKLPSRE